jgi:DNA-directed RNA polymerase
VVQLALVPQAEATVELVRRAQEEERLRARVDEVGRRAREAQAELTAAKEALVELERQAAGAGEVTAAQRRKAEERLTKAEQAAAERWPERRAGAERAAQDGRRALQRHVSEHFAEIVEELEQAGRAAAEQVDHTAQAFLEAVDRRMQAERTLIEVVALTRNMGPNDVARTRTDLARGEVGRLIESGGEQAPELRIAEPVSA